jgi:Flp pilus assembly protein TadD
MQRGLSVLLASAVAVSSLAIHSQAQSSQSAEIQLQLGELLFNEGRYQDAVVAYRNAVKEASPDMMVRARGHLIIGALRIAEFDEARTEAEGLVQANPRSPEALALYGDALWASGLFEQSEAQYVSALSVSPNLARGRHGLARSLAARGRLADALEEAQNALRLSPRDLEIHHTIGTIYERMHRYEEAATSYTNYVNLLPNKDHSNKADWSRAEIRFLQSFGQRVPLDADAGTEDKLFTMPFKLVNEKIIVRAKVNDALTQDFVVDTGSESTVITRPIAVRLGVLPVTYTLSAGVGNVGLRGLQLGRVDSLEFGALKLRNVPVLIKNPPLRDIPSHETESLSPLALGYSMTIDYRTREITFGKHLPVEPSDFTLPLRLYRLATVQGTVDGSHPANFVIDTGGEVISISQATANKLSHKDVRHIALKVWGTSGWDPDAFLLPGVNLAFEQIQYTNFPVVVLNLDAPSALLGFKLGGIVGHKFLSNYRVAIDLERSELRLKKL